MKYHIVLLTATLFLVTNCAFCQRSSDKHFTSKDLASFRKAEKDYQQIQNGLQQLEIQKAELLNMMKAFDEKQKKVLATLTSLEKTYNGLSAAENGQSQLLNATKQMQETQMSYNLQYLQLQKQMQHENRSYTAVSNIMKTKHDTVKNSISNVR